MMTDSWEYKEAEEIIKRITKYCNLTQDAIDDIWYIEGYINRLVYIIDEIEKWIKENNLGKYRTENVVDTDELLDKLKELKGE